MSTICLDTLEEMYQVTILNIPDTKIAISATTNNLDQKHTRPVEVRSARDLTMRIRLKFNKDSHTFWLQGLQAILLTQSSWFRNA